jgi:hypothetical protein
MTGWVEGLADLLGFVGEAIIPEAKMKSRRSTPTRLDMPSVQIEDLPDTSRTWVFGADQDLSDGAADLLLREVDRFLSQWHAHGEPLTAARSWKDKRFLTIAVDQSTAGASGCSIDGLFRSLKALEARLGANMVTSGLIFYRDKKGRVQSVDRDRFAELGAEGKITLSTRVFDPSVTTLGEWRARFELDARDSWHAKLIKNNQPA